MKGFRFPARTWRGLVFVVYGALIVGIALATAGIDPYNSDNVANLVALTNILPDGTLYAVAHTNVLKVPLYSMALVIFGYSLNAVVFVDVVSTIGFNALMAGCALVWTRSQARPYLAALPFLYLATLSPLFILHTTHPGVRNVDIALACVWLVLVIAGSLRLRYRALVVPLAAVLVLNDPWFVATFAFPAVVVTLLLKNRSGDHADAARSRLLAPALVIAGVALGFALRSAIEATQLVRFVGSEMDYRVVSVDRLGFNLGLTFEVLLRYLDAWVFGLPLVNGSVVNGAANLALFGAGAWGLITGARSKDDTVRKISLFVILAAIVNLGLFAFTNAPANLWSGRYIIFAPIAAAMGLAIGLSQWWERGSAHGQIILGLIAVCAAAHMLAVGDTAANLRNPTRNANQQRIVEALARAGLAYGYSDYWNSVNTTFYSGQTIGVRTIYCEDGRLKPRDWWSQSRWYLPNPAHRPSFVLFNLTEPTDLDSCQGDALVQQFGPATRFSIDRGNRHIADVLIWDYDIASKFTP